MTGDFFTGAAYWNILAASTAGSREAAFSGILWLIVVVIVSSVVAVLVGYLRRRFRSADPLPGLGLTLEELRLQHERGNLTVSEFESLKKKLVIDIGIKPSSS